MNYLKNYTKKEIKLDPNFTFIYAEHWSEDDEVKILDSREYLFDNNYKIINKFYDNRNNN